MARRFVRREKRTLDFAVKCTRHEKNKRIFPLNTIDKGHEIRNQEKFHVNFARTTAYQKSAVPTCQRLLNEHFGLQNN